MTHTTSTFMTMPTRFITMMLALAISATTMISPCHSFTMQMMTSHNHNNNGNKQNEQNKYKPPVQTSVQKLQGGNYYGRSSSSSTKKSSSFALDHPDIASSSPFRSTISQQPRPKRPSFQSRMRQALQQKSKITKPRTSSSSSSSTIQEIITLHDFHQLITTNASNQVICVRFYAPWCKACKAMEPQFQRLSKLYPQIKFVNVPAINENSNLHQGLGIPSLPYGQIYYANQGLVDELRITRPFIKQLESKLQSYLDMSCSLIHHAGVDDDAVWNATSPYA